MPASLGIFEQSFWELASERPIGMSYGRIPVTKVLEYMRLRWGIHPMSADGERFLDLILSMDGTFMK